MRLCLAILCYIILYNKHVLYISCVLPQLQVCLVVTMLSAVLSLVAVIIYSVDINGNADTPCSSSASFDTCTAKQFAMVSDGSFIALLQVCEG